MPAVAPIATTPSTTARKPFPGAGTPASPLANMLAGGGPGPTSPAGAATAYAHATNQPPPTVNALAPWSTPAGQPAPQPAMPGQAVPDGAPPSSAPDLHGQFAGALPRVPTQFLVQTAATQDHVLHALGTLLNQRTITPGSVQAAAKRAVDDGHADDGQVAQMLRTLPLNDSPQALRGVLETKMADAAKMLLALHGEAQSRGLDLAAQLNSRGSASVG